MVIAYFDCFSGIAGDMIIGALLAAGAPGTSLEKAVDSLGLGVKLHTEAATVNGISSTRFLVESLAQQPLRHLQDIKAILNQADVPSQIKAQAHKIFLNLAQAEAEVHGIAVEQVHFHEIGAVDTIVDILGALLCLQELNISQVYSSPLPWNTGFVSMSHGQYPLPAPATARLLQGIPVVGCSYNRELVTPTGAAILTALCSSFGPFPAATPRSIGYGAGTLDRQDGVPNVLRVVVAETDPAPSVPYEQIGVVETQVDDMNPELFTRLFEVLHSDPEVLDVFSTPVSMKKNRPGVLVTVLVRIPAIQKVASLLVLHTTSLGARFRIESRYAVQRQQSNLETPWGPVKIKIARLPDGTVRIKPEFEDCQAIARSRNISLVEVYTVINRLLPELGNPTLE